MQAYGNDRLRVVAGKSILQSRIPKGWTPRTPKTLTHAEFPGTTVLWDEEYYEVVAADVMEGGIRYVLEPWREEHTIRTFESYDAESEARRAADWERARRQRRFSLLARIAGMVVGHAPAPVQNRLARELGVAPARMTIISCIPSVALLGICVWLEVDSILRRVALPIPIWIWLVAVFLVVESAIRFHVAMQQNRGMGSLFGTAAYLLLWYLAPRKERIPPPLTERGDAAFFMLPPSEDVVLRDSLTVRGPLLTLLSPGDQRRLAERFGFDYRQHSAVALTWSILAVALIGAVSSLVKLERGGGSSALVSAIVAVGLAVEQILRLVALQRGPAGSILRFLVRPFMRRML